MLASDWFQLGLRNQLRLTCDTYSVSDYIS